MAFLRLVWMIISRYFNNVVNFFINYFSSGRRVPATSINASFAVTVAALLMFLQLKSQGNGEFSPFQTHPKTINVAIASLIGYGLVHDFEERLSSTHQVYSDVAHKVRAVFGSLLVASLASILFPDSIRPALYLASLLCADELELGLWFWRRTVSEVEQMEMAAFPV